MPTTHQDIPDKITFRLGKATLIKLAKEAARQGLSPHQLAKQMVEDRLALLTLELAIEEQSAHISHLAAEASTTTAEVHRLRSDIATTLEAFLIASRTMKLEDAKAFVDHYLRH